MRQLLLLTSILLVACVRSPAPSPVMNLAGSLPVAAPETAVVGTPLVIQVGPANAPDGTAVTLTFLGSYGSRVLTTHFQEGMAHFQVPAAYTEHSGVVNLVVAAGAARGEATLTLLPAAPVNPITPLVGARSIIADGDHWAMVVIIPFDRFGNPVAEGTPVQIQALHPGKNLETQTANVAHLLAWARLYSGTKAGRTSIAASIDQVRGPEGTLLEIPGWPTDFTITADPESLPADGFELVTLRTSVMADEFGNVMPDGTLVAFLVQGPDGSVRSLPAVTIDGAAETVMQAPVVAGAYQVTASVYGRSSTPLTVQFTPGPALGPIPIAMIVDEVGGFIHFVAGPVVGELGQYVPDGTAVSFTLQPVGQLSHQQTAVTDGGYAQATWRTSTFSATNYTITVTAGAGMGDAQFTYP